MCLDESHERVRRDEEKDFGMMLLKYMKQIEKVPVGTGVS
jgi:hypothetical protein